MTKGMIRFATIATPLAVILGAVLGYYWPEPFAALGFIGVLFVNLLKLVAIPLIVIGLILGVGTLGSRKRVAGTFGRTLAYFVGTTFVAVLIGLAVASILSPGDGVTLKHVYPPDQINLARQWTIGQAVQSMIPSNPLAAIGQGNIFALALLSLLLGAVLAVLGPRRRAAIDVFRSLHEGLVRLLGWIMLIAPLGLLFLTGRYFASQPDPWANLGALGGYGLALLIGLLVHGVLALSGTLTLWGNRPLGQYAYKMLPAFGTAFATGSKAISLPASYHAVVGDGRVDNRAGAVVLPLGAALNFGGTALYVTVTALFAAQVAGIDLSALQVVVIALMATFASFVTAGLPLVAPALIALVFEAAGMPEAAFSVLGMAVGLAWLAERACSVVDVWSDAVGASVVANALTTGSSTKARPEKRERRPERRQAKSDRRSQRRDDDKPARRERDRERDRRQPDRRDSRSDRPPRGRRDSRSGSDRRDRRPQRSGPDSRSPFEMKPQSSVDVESITHGPVGESASEEPSKPRRDRREARPERRERSRRPERPQDRSESRRNEPRRDRSPRPPRDEERELVKREKRRVQAQLEQMDEPKAPEPDEKEPVKPVSQQPREPELSDGPAIDFAAEGFKEETPEAKPEPSGDFDSDAVDTPAEDPDSIIPDDTVEDTTAPAREPDQEEAAPNKIEYGRRNRVLRPAGSSPDEPDDAEMEDMPEAVDSFSVSEQSFGRAKKKRTR